MRDTRNKTPRRRAPRPQDSYSQLGHSDGNRTPHILSLSLPPPTVSLIGEAQFLS